MADQDVMVGQKTTQTAPEDKIGKLEAEKPSEGEVGGRAITVRAARCGNCGYVGYINYDTVNYHIYQCNSCGAYLVF